MTQAINPIKLKAAAEHLEWVLKEYPDEQVVQSMLDGLLPLIEDAKAGRVLEPVGRSDIPFAFNVADGRYTAYTNPNVEGAYFEFSVGMRGGRDEQETQLIADTKAMMERMNARE